MYFIVDTDLYGRSAICYTCVTFGSCFIIFKYNMLLLLHFRIPHCIFSLFGPLVVFGFVVILFFL